MPLSHQLALTNASAILRQTRTSWKFQGGCLEHPLYSYLHRNDLLDKPSIISVSLKSRITTILPHRTLLWACHACACRLSCATTFR